MQLQLEKAIRGGAGAVASAVRGVTLQLVWINQG